MSILIDYLEFWYAALRSPMGVSIRTNNQRVCRDRLRDAKRRSGDPDLNNYFIAVPDDDHLWLVPRTLDASLLGLTDAESE